MTHQSRAVVVRELSSAAAAARWDDFVEGCTNATFFHLAGWQRVMSEAFGHPTHFLYAECGDEIVGVLPLVHVKSRLFGNALISSAFAVEGGPATSRPEAAAALEGSALQLAERLDVDYVEFRCRHEAGEGWHLKSDLYVSFCKPIDADVDANLRAVPRKQRAMVRKGIKAGLTSTIDETVDVLHHIYAVSVRNLGTPVFSKRYFTVLKRVFGPRCDIVTIRDGEQPIASVMNFYLRDRVMPYYGGATTEARAVAANDFMYWEVMRRACERGYRCFDFGRSKVGTGAFAFKKHWGFDPEPLSYAFFLRRGDSLPEVNPSNPKYRLMIGLWKGLPLPLSKAIGPMISRSLG